MIVYKSNKKKNIIINDGLLKRLKEMKSSYNNDKGIIENLKIQR